MTRQTIRKVNCNKHDNVIVVGSGSIALNCIRYLRNFITGKIYVFEYQHNKVSGIKESLNKLDNVYYDIVDGDIVDKINKIQSKIIFSINNVYIFTKDVIEKHLIINYHNSLLPEHPGRFAESWVIYDGEEYTGVTWHIVSDKVDKGEIIIQKKIKLDEKEYTALTLAATQVRLAYKCFIELCELIYVKNEIPIKENNCITTSRKFHYSWEKPNNGYLVLEWDINKISRFLRSMDYGPLKLLGDVRFEYGNKSFTFTNYKIEYLSEFYPNKIIQYIKDKNNLVIFENKICIRLIGISED